MTLPSTKTYQYLLIATIFLGSLVLFWGLGSVQLMSLNEGRRALAIKEMFSSGSWLIPTQNGELYLTKPPLLYWISASFCHVFGEVNEWTLRLPSALAALATLCMTYQFTLKKFGVWPALFSAQILIANVGFAMLARRVEIEMLLTALCLGALLSALKYKEVAAKQRWIYLSYFLLGLAVLAKGPVALLFVTLPLIIAMLWTKDDSIKKVLTSVRAWAVFFAVALSWYTAVSWQLGFDIWGAIAKRDMLEKMQAVEVAKPLLSYVGWIAIDFLLLLAVLFVRPKSLFKRYSGNNDWLTIVASVAAPVLIFSLFSNKHAKYMLPIYPLIAIILGVQLGLLFDAAKATVKKVIVILGVLLPVVFACYYMFAEARIFSYRTVALSQFQDWSSSISVDTLYALGNVDSRLIYYANNPVKVVDAQELKRLQDSHSSLLILAEEANKNAAIALAHCKIKEFKPYLKKNKALTVFGIGGICHAKNI